MANPRSRTKNSALSLVTGIGGQLLNEALRFITRTVFIYTLGKMFLGINGLFAEIMTMLSLTNLGVGTAIVYRLYKPIANNDEQQVRILLKFYKKAYQAIGAVILILGLCLFPFLKVLIKDYDRLGNIGLNAEVVFLLFLAKCVVSYFFFAYRNCIFAADQKQYIVNSVNMITNIITAVVQIVVLFLWQDFIVYLLVEIIDGILKNIVVAVLTRKQYPQYFLKEPFSLPKNEIKTMFKDCGALLIYRMNGVVQKSTGNFMLSAFIGLEIVGLYSNYLVIYVAIRTLCNQMFSAVMGSMGNLFASNTSMKDKFKFFKVMNYLTIIVFGTLAVELFVNVNSLIYCWIGEGYVIEQPFPLLLGIEILVMGLVRNLNQIRNVTGLFRQMWTRPLLSMMLNIFVTLFAVQNIGVLALPLGFIISTACTNLVADPIVIYKHGFKDKYHASHYFWSNAKYLIVLIFVGTISYLFCDNYITTINWGFLILRVIVTAALSVGALFLCFYKTEANQYLVKKFLKK